MIEEKKNVSIDEMMKEQTKETDDVEVWLVRAGALEQIRIKGDLFVINKDYPKHLNPIKVCREFNLIIDVQATAILRKANAPQKIKPKENGNGKAPFKLGPGVAGPGVHTGLAKVIETGELLGKMGIIAIYKDKVEILYRRLPETFTSKEAIEIFTDLYGEVLSPETIYNKATGYLKYFRDNDFIEVVSQLKASRRYRFITAPFGFEKPAQAEPLDKEGNANRKLTELEMIRKA